VPILLLLVLAYVPVQGQIYTTASPNSVELTTQGAYVVSETPAIALVKGVNQVRIMGLSFDAQLDQLQFFMGQSAWVVHAELISDSSTFFNDPLLRIISRALHQMEDSLQGVLFTESQIGYLKTILDENMGIEVSDKSIYTDDLDELLGFYAKKLRNLQKDLTTAKLHKKRLVHQIDSLKQAKQNRLTTLAPAVHGVQLNIVADFDMEQPVRISFFTQLATWAPQYGLKAQMDKAELDVNAMVSQHTGFNWNNVQLRLSYDQTGNRKSLKYGSHAVTFLLPYPVQLGNGQSMFVPKLSNYRVAARQLFVCDPSLSHLSQPILEIKELKGIFLPEGTITVGTATNGQVQDSFISGLFQDSMTLSLPMTHEVVSTKYVVKEKLSNSLVGNKASSKVEWVATITNSTPIEQTIIFRDRIPFASANPNVLMEYNLPKGAVKYNGYFELTLLLPANERMELNYGFEITAPKGTNLNEYIEK
jgi:hypothetical protein